MKKQLKKILYPVVSFMLLLAIAALIMNIAGVDKEIGIFYITYNDDILVNNTSGVVVFSTKENAFKINSVLSEAKEYSVKIESSDKIRFSYYAGDTAYSYEDLDLTDYFKIDIKDEGFIINCDCSINSILSAKHDGAEITLPKNLPSSIDYFMMTVTVHGIENEVKIYFHGDTDIGVTGVELPSNLEF